ncbi:MAG: histidine kinase [Candidatus Abyssobacteria bacterium SURF_5]|uniref:histidine kinase n=1 Tax=Abyssobacteria bacterium (strain SURF_5) TaxID=2093360 RepID=A0A3A4NPW6_ABYX5|nr:MAG: histidine kinase [Candidatus Abyssubacteria bacterium SURF_5]
MDNQLSTVTPAGGNQSDGRPAGLLAFWSRLGLRSRILITLGGLVVITAAGGIVMIWYTYRMEKLLMSVLEENVASLQVAKGLETALLNQRGYVSYYLLEKNPDWLKELGRSRQDFDERMREARALECVGGHAQILDKIEAEYRTYIDGKDETITLYLSGHREEGEKLHRDLRQKFSKVLELCGEYNEMHNREIHEMWLRGQAQARGLRGIAAAAVSAAVLIGGFLSFVLVVQILDPIRRLAIQTSGKNGSDRSLDEVAALKSGVRGLMEDVDQTHLELERSRTRLLQSERMALVGKLAAEAAHSIRNPMTSIKMRLFSLQRSIGPAVARDDFDVISEELRHLDNIVRNFLEFSRPPKLKVQKVDVSDAVDSVLQLLEKRLERHGVKLERERRNSIPCIDADPELLKEVMVNLIVNACDAMGEGGKILITEEEGLAEEIGRVALIQIADTGPGIPESIRDKIFQPFFTTKEEGTGLGLSIAARIVEEHGGRLTVRSEENLGATFIIALPIKEEPA